MLGGKVLARAGLRLGAPAAGLGPAEAERDSASARLPDDHGSTGDGTRWAESTPICVGVAEGRSWPSGGADLGTRGGCDSDAL
eukprot:scaffold29642_cov101-Isochrysis_galbana.AAC.2